MKPLGIERKKPQLITLDTIDPTEITWLWYPYIPIGAISAIFGRGGGGKTHLTCDIASRLSTGRPLPGAEDNKIPQRVLMLSAEDDYNAVLVPRLMRMGANLKNIAVPDFQFTLDPWGIEQISDLMRDFAATVVFIDPIVYYAGGKMDINRSNEVRAMMEKLKSAAEQAKCAAIIVGHTRKSQEGSDADGMMGSADWVNASRSALLVTKTNDGTRIMKHAKTNWGILGEHRSFDITDRGVEWLDVYTDDNVPPTNGGKTGGKMSQVIAWLKDTLARGPVAAGEIERLAQDEGFPMVTVNRAKLNVAESFYHRTEKKYFWRLTQGDQ